MRQQYRGYTLIELMMTVAVVGLVATITIPSYEHYSLRSKVAEGLALAGDVRIAVAEARLSEGRFLLGDNASYGLPPGESLNGNHVARITVREEGVIAVAYAGDAALAGRELLLRPTVAGGSVRWDCTGGNLSPQLRPGNCRG